MSSSAGCNRPQSSCGGIRSCPRESLCPNRCAFACVHWSLWVHQFRCCREPHWIDESGDLNAFSFRGCLTRAIREEIVASRLLNTESTITAKRESSRAEAKEDIPELFSAWDRFLSQRRIVNLAEYSLGTAGAAYAFYRLVKISWSGSSALFGYSTLALYLIFAWFEFRARRAARQILKEYADGADGCRSCFGCGDGQQVVPAAPHSLADSPLRDPPIRRVPTIGIVTLTTVSISVHGYRGFADRIAVTKSPSHQ